MFLYNSFIKFTVYVLYFIFCFISKNLQLSEGTIMNVEWDRVLISSNCIEDQSNNKNEETNMKFLSSDVSLYGIDLTGLPLNHFINRGKTNYLKKCDIHFKTYILSD